jgi:tRNA1(Val) A37 N6-methylase TrmN6
MADFSYDEAQIAGLISEFTDPKTREAIELSSLPEILHGAAYFIDVGANVGLYTFHAAKHLRNAKLLAIEANPYLIPVLTRTVETSMRSRLERFQTFRGRWNFMSADFPRSVPSFPTRARRW